MREDSCRQLAREAHEQALQKELQQARVRRKWLRLVGLVLLIRTISLALFATYAMQARTAGEAQQVRTESVKDFLILMFRGQDPWIQNFHSTDQLSNAPSVRAELLYELGAIQVRMGEHEQAVELLQRAEIKLRAVYPDQDTRLLRKQILVAENQNRQLNYDTARQQISGVLDRSQENPQAKPLDRAQAIFVLATILRAGGGEIETRQ